MRIFANSGAGAMGECRLVISTSPARQQRTRSGHGTSAGDGSRSSGTRAAVSTASRRRDLPGGSEDTADSHALKPAAASASRHSGSVRTVTSWSATTSAAIAAIASACSG